MGLRAGSLYSLHTDGAADERTLPRMGISTEEITNILADPTQ